MTTTLRDAHGQALSTTDRASLAAYEHALDLFHGYRMDPVAVLTPVLERDPGFVSGQLLMAGMLLGSIDGQFHAMAKACVDAAAASPQKANERERSLIAALGAWSDGEVLRANQLLGRHLIDHPRDLLALQLAHVGDLFLGHSFMLRDRVARSLTQWSADDKGYGYLLGMHAFGLEECNEYARAEAVGRRAVELQPHDSWAVHAVAHVCEMQGRAADGIRWLKATAAPLGDRLRHGRAQPLAPGADAHGRRRHRRGARALRRRGHARARSHRAQPRRCQRAAVAPVPARRRRVGALAGPGRPLAPAGRVGCARLQRRACGDGAGRRRRRSARTKAGIAAIAESARRPGAQAAVAVALPAAGGLQAFAAGRYAHCVEQLLPLLAASSPFGGSHAQRDLLHLTVIEAAFRAGDRALVRAMGDERAARNAGIGGRPPRGPSKPQSGWRPRQPRPPVASPRSPARPMHRRCDASSSGPRKPARRRCPPT